MFVFVVVILIPNLKAKFRIRSVSEQAEGGKSLESKEINIIKKILQL